MNDIRQFKGIHEQQAGFVIGTGPSLGKTPLHLLDDQITFGVNALYQQSDIECTYYGISCGRNLARYYPDIFRKVKCPIFLSHTAGVLYLSDEKYRKARSQDIFVLPGINVMEPLWTRGWLIRDIEKGVYWTRTVVMDTCVQVAYYMDLDPVCVVGCDSSWKGQHYLDPGIVLANPPGDSIIADIFKSYAILRRGFEEEGRELLNCTVGGELEELKRDTIENVIRRSA